jgi:hypothetical protein
VITAPPSSSLKEFDRDAEELAELARALLPRAIREDEERHGSALRRSKTQQKSWRRNWQAVASAEAVLTARVVVHDAQIDAWFRAACATDPLRLAWGSLDIGPPTTHQRQRNQAAYAIKLWHLV